MAGTGGKRPGAGRKTNAQKLLEAGFVCKAFSLDLQERTWNSLLASDDEAIVIKAMTYLTDRIYGKAVEKQEISGLGGGAIEHAITVKLVKSGDADRNNS